MRTLPHFKRDFRILRINCLTTTIVPVDHAVMLIFDQIPNHRPRRCPRSVSPELRLGSTLPFSLTLFAQEGLFLDRNFTYFCPDPASLLTGLLKKLGMNLFLKSLITSLLKKGLSENLLRKGFIVNFQKKQRLGW